MRKEHNIKAITCSFAATLTVILAGHQVSLATTDEVLNAPDLSCIQHMDEDYFSSCSEISGKDENYIEFENDLNNLNGLTFNVIKGLSENNKKIRKAITKLSAILTKINTSVINKDIRRTKKKVLKEMESLKDKLLITRESIQTIQEQVKTSQQNIGTTYCRADQYVSLYISRAESAAERQWHKQVAYDTATAADMSRKRQKLFIVMLEFDTYFGLLEELFNHAEEKFSLIDSVQKNIVSFVDMHCKIKSEPCRFEEKADLRFDEAQLADIMARIEKAFVQLIETAQSNFSGSKQAGKMEVSNAIR